MDLYGKYKCSDFMMSTPTSHTPYTNICHKETVHEGEGVPPHGWFGWQRTPSS